MFQNDRGTSKLEMRSRILRGIREFFWVRNFLEVETPIVLSHPSQEPYLEPLRTTVHDHRGKAYDGFLRMSPEFSLKKLIASMRGETSGVGGKTPDVEERMRGIFEIGPVFRDGEPWNDAHNPEFTMLEWYEIGADYRKLMATCENLITHVVGSTKSQAPNSKQIPNSNDQNYFSPSLGEGEREGVGPSTLTYQGQVIDCVPPWERLTMRQAWKRYAHLDLDELLGARGKHRVLKEKHPMLRSARNAMATACRAKGYTVTHNDTFDDLFFRIHLTEVEQKLGRSRPTFLTDWPSQMAALARRKQNNPRYAERVELYIGGLEIANGFSELTDADEQLARFRADRRLRRRIGERAYPIDMEFIAALRRMPPTAGIALGIDRLVMLLTDATTIDEVRWLPASALFRSPSAASRRAERP